MSIKNNNYSEASSYPREEILCISYFDQIIGPSQFYCQESLDDNEHPNLNRILEFNDELGSFIFAFRKYQTVNHIFNISSEYARGGEELLMISYMIRAAYFRNEIVDVFKYLESKKPILESYAEELKNLKELPEILHNKNKSGIKDTILDIGSQKFKNDFLKLYEKYLIELSPKFKVESPIHLKQVSKKIFIFGERYTGKTTFLKNVEDIQFHNQINNDLPTMIYEIIIDNLAILTYDCFEQDFDCDRCKNFGGCIKNAQGFIVMLNASDKNSVSGGLEKFQKIVNKCQEIGNQEVPILIIGNIFDDRGEFESDYIYNKLNFKELRDCGMKVKYFPINVKKEKGKIMQALRWLVRHMI
ncbi:MAG: ADP-ribosylation factor-like protein [Promethearchaeota archaeon]